MKTINSFRSKLFALTLAIVASVSSFAYEFEYVNDFHINGFAYKVLPSNTLFPYGSAALIEIADCNKDVVIPEFVSYGNTEYRIITFGIGSVVFTNDASSVVESITIPKTTSVINKNALAGCPNLKTVVVDSENPYYDSRENCNAIITTSQNPYFTPNTLIAGCKTTIIPNSVAEIGDNAFYNSALESITIPTATTKIGRSAFNNSILLSSITLSATLIEISDWAFADCLSLNTIICYAIEPPTISSNTFFGSNPIYNNPTIYVPAESVEAYKNAEHWKWFTKVLPIEPTTDYKSQWCDTWNVLNLGYWTNSWTTKEDFETWKYCLAHDTIIGNYTYTAVTRQTTKVPEGVYPFIAPAPEYVAAVRFTDDSKVYIHYDNTEYLLYDFNVQPGDELTVFAGINHYHSHKTNTCRIHEVERTPGLEYSTKISLMVIPDFTGDVRPACAGETKWIEGVGDLCGFITGADCGLSDEQSALLCAYKEGNQEYSTELEEYAEYGCEYNTASGEYTSTLAGLQRTSCTKTIGEDEYGTVWGSRSYLMQETQTTTIDGKQYIVFGDEYDRFALREENNKILLYSSILKKDLVLYDFTLEVGDSLPALYYELRAHDTMHQWLYIGDIVDYNKDDDGTILPAETFVVTDISTITLLDGKEYKKWTFDNGMEYVEGIGSFGTSYAWNDFYQLIANGPLYSDVFSQHLVCVSKNNKLLYQMDDAEMEQLETECLCEYNDGPKKDNAKDGKIGGRPTPTQWNMLEMVVREMENNKTILLAETFSYTLEDNSRILNNKTYFDLARQSTRDTAITKSVVGALHFSEDEGNRVYFLCDGMEYLLYDFTAELGDTLDIFAGINNYPQETTYTHVVTGKDTLENGACRMMLEVVLPEETASLENAQKVWLAGLGSIDGIVHNAAIRATKARSSETQTSVMLCAWRDDDCLYTTDHPDFINVGCEYNVLTAVEDIQTSGDKYQKIIRDGHLYILRDGKIYDVLGTPLN